VLHGFWNSSCLLEPPSKCLFEDPNILSLKMLSIVGPMGGSLLLLCVYVCMCVCVHVCVLLFWVVREWGWVMLFLNYDGKSWSWVSLTN
jgi:hypothetical protein